MFADLLTPFHYLSSLIRRVRGSSRGGGGAGGLLLLLASRIHTSTRMLLYYSRLLSRHRACQEGVEGYRLSTSIESPCTVVIQDCLLSTKNNFSLMSYIHHQHHGRTGGSDVGLELGETHYDNYRTYSNALLGRYSNVTSAANPIPKPAWDAVTVPSDLKSP
jgi:hypothetical protein